MPKRRLIYTSIKRLFKTVFLTFTSLKIMSGSGWKCLRGKLTQIFALRYLLLVFLVFLTFAFPHTSLVPSQSACWAVGFVPNMHCQLAHYLMHIMWTAVERVWERAGGATACCLLNFLLCRGWQPLKLCLYAKEHILHWVAQGIKACKDKQRMWLDSTL